MSTLQNDIQPSATKVTFAESEMIVSLKDGRSITVPLAWFASLAAATSEQRADYQLLGGGVGIHWPQLDEDISIAGLLTGIH